jgi:hypothetical protein
MPKSDFDITDCCLHQHFLMEIVLGCHKSKSTTTYCGVHCLVRETVFELCKSDSSVTKKIKYFYL